MPIEECYKKEQYLFTTYESGASKFGLKDTGNPVALGVLLAPLTLGASFVVGLAVSDARKGDNSKKLHQNWVQDHVGVIVEKNEMIFQPYVDGTNVNKDDYYIDFKCPFCAGSVKKFYPGEELRFLIVNKHCCAEDGREVYWYLEEPNVLIVLESYRVGDWYLKEGER